MTNPAAAFGIERRIGGNQAEGFSLDEGSELMEVSLYNRKGFVVVKNNYRYCLQKTNKIIRYTLLSRVRNGNGVKKKH